MKTVGTYILKNKLTAVCAAFVLLFSLIQVITIWRVRYVAYQDYPSHLYRNIVLSDYNTAPERYKEYFLINWSLAPNQLADLIVFILSKIFSVQAAIKIFLSLYYLILPVACFYCYHSFDPEHTPYILFPAVLSINVCTVLFYMSYLSGMIFFLFFMGYWIRNRYVHTLKTYAIRAILAALLYFSHMLPFGLACALIFFMCITEKKKLTVIIKEMFVFAPFFIIFILWVISVKTSYTSTTALMDLPPLYTNPMRALRSFFQSVYPAFFDLTPILFMIAYYIFMISIVITTGIFYRSIKYRNMFWIVLCLVAISLFLPKWFIILDPAQRTILLLMFLVPLFFPVQKKLLYTFCIFLIIFTCILRIQETKFLINRDTLIAHTVEPFEHIPEKYLKGKIEMLPIILPPYTYKPEYHRAFEYFNILHGGVNPHHILSIEFTVRYMRKYARPSIYMTEAKDYPEDTLKEYSFAVVIGKDGTGGQEIMQHLSLFGFTEISGNDITAVMHKKP
ncbi:hypothetical protein ACFL6D_05470 [Spirochaetota bacterium]